MEELTIVVPTKGVMYNFVCKCWLARDKGDGLTSRTLNILDAECVNIGIKVGTRLTLCLQLLQGSLLTRVVCQHLSDFDFCLSLLFAFLSWGILLAKLAWFRIMTV